MADGRAPGRPGETPVGKQRDCLTQALAHNGGGGRKHFSHARAALGPFAFDDDHVAGDYFAVQYGLGGVLHVVKDPGPAAVLHHLGADRSGLNHTAHGGQVSEQHRQTALGAVRGIYVADHLVILHEVARQKLAHGLSRHREAAGVDQPRPIQLLYDGVYAAGPVQVIHVVMSVGTDMAEVGGAETDLVKLFKRQGDAQFICDGGQVQRGVGGAGNGHVHPDGVFKGPLSENVTGADIALHKLHGAHARPFRQGKALAVIGRNGSVSGQGHAQSLSQTVHGVCGEHAGAGAAAGAAVLGQFLLLFLAHIPVTHLAHSFDAGAVIGDLPLIVPGGHGAAADDDGGDIHSRRRHKGAGYGLVTAYHQHKAIKAVGHGHGLNAVGDQLPAGQRVHHALVGHSNPVADGNGGKLHRDAPRHQNALLCRVRYAAQMEMAGYDLIEGVHHADKGLSAYVLLKMARSVQQASGVGVLHARIYFFAVKHPFHSFAMASFAASTMSCTASP